MKFLFLSLVILASVTANAKIMYKKDVKELFLNALAKTESEFKHYKLIPSSLEISNSENLLMAEAELLVQMAEGVDIDLYEIHADFKKGKEIYHLNSLVFVGIEFDKKTNHFNRGIQNAKVTFAPTSSIDKMWDYIQSGVDESDELSKRFLIKYIEPTTKKGIMCEKERMLSLIIDQKWCEAKLWE